MADNRPRQVEGGVMSDLYHICPMRNGYARKLSRARALTPIYGGVDENGIPSLTKDTDPSHFEHYYCKECEHRTMRVVPVREARIDRAEGQE